MRKYLSIFALFLIMAGGMYFSLKLSLWTPFLLSVFISYFIFVMFKYLVGDVFNQKKQL